MVLCRAHITDALRERSMDHYGKMQNAIYNAGLRGILPDYPVDFASLEARAAMALSSSMLNYVQGGCGDEYTQESNAEAFHHWGIVPRMLVDCTERDLSIELFGLKLPSPIFMAPIGVNGEVTQDRKGDLAAARASAATGVPFCASTLSNTPMEEVAQATSHTPGFFQLYTPKNEDLTASLLRRAKGAGYRAIVITLDTWVTGWRPRDLNTATRRRSVVSGDQMDRGLRQGTHLGRHRVVARSHRPANCPKGNLPW